jgi:hypothetical protein
MFKNMFEFKVLYFGYAKRAAFNFSKAERSVQNRNNEMSFRRDK